MAEQIRLSSGTATESEVIIENAEGLEIIYRPALLSRSVKRRIGEKTDALNAHFEKVRKSRRAVSDADEERTMRLMCDAISLVVTASKEETPAAGDLLYDGWIEDRVSDDQIVGLFNALYTTSDSEDGDSPS